MGRNNKDFKSAQISDSQHLSQLIRNNPDVAGYQKARPARYTSEEGFQEGTPKIKGMKPKRIRQAFGRE